jgi:hypothetical protein
MFQFADAALNRPPFNPTRGSGLGAREFMSAGVGSGPLTGAVGADEEEDDDDVAHPVAVSNDAAIATDAIRVFFMMPW